MHVAQWEQNFQHATPTKLITPKSFQTYQYPEFSSQWSSQNCFRDFLKFCFSNFEWLFSQKIQIHHGDWKQKPILSGQWAIVEQKGVKCGTGMQLNNTYRAMGYLWSCSIQGHFGVIRWTQIFSSDWLSVSCHLLSWRTHPSSVRRPSVHRPLTPISRKQLYSCRIASCPPYFLTVFSFFKIFNFFFFVINIRDPMGAKISTHYS